MGIIRRRPVSFWATKKISKPVVVKFIRYDGTLAKFKATKFIKKPTKVSFYARRKRYR